jgi:hypothetical protein
MMRVTIEHREEATGFSGKSRNYFVDCRVEFAEEEKAIIQARALRDQIVMEAHLRPPPPPPLKSKPFWLRVAGPWLMFAGFVIGFLSLFTNAGGNLGPMLFFVGAGFWLYGVIGFNRQQAPWDAESITIGTLLSPRPVSIYATDPASAKVLDERFREALVGVKQLVSASAKLRDKETFDL